MRGGRAVKGVPLTWAMAVAGRREPSMAVEGGMKSCKKTRVLYKPTAWMGAGGRGVAGRGGWSREAGGGREGA